MATVTTLRDLSISYSTGTALYDKNREVAYIFGTEPRPSNNTAAPTLEGAPILEYNPSTDTSRIVYFSNFPGITRFMRASATDDKRGAGYIIGGFNSNGSILQVDYTTRQVGNISVQNLPGVENGTILDRPATIFVPKLDRIYILGGALTRFNTTTNLVESTTVLDDIYYIDLLRKDETETTTAPTTDTPTTPTTSIPISADCAKKPDGFYPDPDVCKAFFGCLAGKGSDYLCPKELLFDPVKLKCNFPHLVVCNFTYKNKPNGIYADPNSTKCDTFFGCMNGVKNSFKCPNLLVFDRSELRCNYPLFVKWDNSKR
ncbi:putative endochitinase [Folsomia candida]|uniref:Putative endochitinase n=1 Tax=Folsomia candida TaxID=158441 RepID=A0A226DH65_FOLCA|nr:putative endochitinase [Folsomia candida]